MSGLALSRQGAHELAALQPPIDPATFPRSQPGSSICLPSSGRRLGYCEHVDTSIPTDQLRTVVLLPGIPGTRLFSHPAVQRRGCVPGWRLIVLERPGIGLSDPAPELYGYTDFVKDFREFCALLGLVRVAVIGFSAGTPFATALACVPPPAAPPPPPAALSSPAPAASAPAASAPAPAASAPAAAESAAAPSAATASPATSPSTAATTAVEPEPGPAGIDVGTQLEVSPSASARQEGCRAGQADGGETRETHGSGAADGAAAPDVTDGAAAAGAVADGIAGGAASGAGEEAGAAHGEAGCSGGRGGAGAAVAAAAAELVVDGVALVSAIGPPDTPNKRQGMALLFQVAYWACARAPWLVGWLVRSEAAAFRRRPLHALRQGFAPYSGKADVAALKRSEVERMFLESAMEMYGRGQEDAVLRENLLFAGRPCWDFDLAACRTPVAIWQGGQDRGCTAAMATHLAQQLGPTARAKVVPELGHMSYFDLWEEVVDWVNGLRRV